MFLDFDVRIYSETSNASDVFSLFSNMIMGRAEVYYHGQWEGVCGNLITMLEANALCRSVGYM